MIPGDEEDKDCYVVTKAIFASEDIKQFTPENAFSRL